APHGVVGGQGGKVLGGVGAQARAEIEEVLAERAGPGRVDDVDVRRGGAALEELAIEDELLVRRLRGRELPDDDPRLAREVLQGLSPPLDVLPVDRGADIHEDERRRLPDTARAARGEGEGEGERAGDVEGAHRRKAG